MLTDIQKEAIEAFLLVRCRKKGCEGPWCEVQAKIWKAFDYPDDWKIQKKIEAHHRALKDFSSQLQELSETRLSAETLKQSARLTSRLDGIYSCLYNKHFRPPPAEIKRGTDNFKERISEVVGSGEDWVIVDDEGKVGVSGGTLGDLFDSDSLCEACYPGISKTNKG